MQSIEDKAINTYNDNMNYFKAKHEKLFNNLSALEVMLEDGSYPQKYDLEYKDDYFDVIELSSGHYLYNQNSQSYGDNLCNQINMKKDKQVCETFYNLDFTEEAVLKANKSEAIFAHATTAPIIAYYNKYINAEMNFNTIYKFIFLGLGLATHLSKIMSKINPGIVLLVEDDLELFRLSLFTCDYANNLKNSTVIFSIAQREEDLRMAFRALFETNMHENQYLKFSLFSNAYESKIKLLQEFIVTRPEKCYPHERILHKNQRVLQRIHEKKNFINLEKKENETFFKDKPVLVLAAGPSLHNNIEWLQKNKNNFITIAVFATLRILQKYNIAPDIIIQLDEKVNEGVTLVKSFDNFDFVKNSLFILSPSVPDIYFDTFNNQNIFLVEDRSYYKQKELQISAASVGEVAYSIALLFNAKETYLLGLDLALSDDGSTHGTDHHGKQKANIDKVDTVPTVTNLILSTLKVKGNFRELVVTTPLLSLSIPKVNAYTRRLKSASQNVFNLCDGVYFNDIPALHISDIKSLKPFDKKDVLIDLRNLFTKYSTSSFTEEEVLSFKHRQKQLETIRSFVENFKNAPTINAALFTGAYKIFTQNIMLSEKNELRELLLVYTYNTSSYIIDFFNTQELNDIKKHTKEFKKIIIIQYNKIIDYYEDILNENT